MLNKNANIYVPDGSDLVQAQSRTTRLCIAAHQDDVEFMAYSGADACYGKRDEWFSAVVTADGAGSPRSGIYAEYTDEEMKQVRVVEQQRAAHLGDYSVMVQLGYPSKNIKDGADQAIIADYVALLKDMKPEIVYTHNPADKHETHLGVCVKTVEAIRRLDKAERPKKLIGCETWRSLDWVCDNEKELLDTTRHPNIGAAMSAVFDSQILGGKRYDLASEGRRRANATFFASHSTDEIEMMNFGIDMTALILDDSLSVKDFIFGYIARFKSAVDAALDKVL